MRLRAWTGGLLLVGTVLLATSCGDDGDGSTPVTVPASPTPTRPGDPITPPSVVMASTTPTPIHTTAAVATSTPTPSPSPSPSASPAGTISIRCDFRTAYTCAGGPRDGEVCRPGAAVPCPEGECLNRAYFCKGGPSNGLPCELPERTRTPDPCNSDAGGSCVNSDLRVCTELACPIIVRPVAAGALSVTCDAGGDNCHGKFEFFDAVALPGIGFICVTEIAPEVLNCPSGKLDCEGGGALDYSLLQDHNIGACDTSTGLHGNQGCEQHCRAYCGARGQEMIDFGCSGFCQGGLRADEPCECDAPTITCSGPSCPLGACIGKDNPTPADLNVCNCQCLATSGNPSRPGALNFRMPAQIAVEAALPCGEGARVFTLSPQCIPLTTETTSGLLINANNQPGAQIPREGVLTATGAPVSCQQLMHGDTAGMNIESHISFFDSTIGDLEVQINWFCK